MKDPITYLAVIARRVFVFYLAVFLLAYVTLNHKDFLYKAKLQTLNRLIPSFSELTSYVNDGSEVNPKMWDKYIHYFQKITEYIPFLADAHFLLGYCYYQNGEEQKATSAYQESIKLNAEFFWAHYNLGVIYFHNGEFEKAAQAFEKALAMNPDVSLKIILASRAYVPILQQLDDPITTIVAGLKIGFKDCARLLLLSKLYQQQLPEGIDATLAQNVQQTLRLRLY